MSRDCARHAFSTPGRRWTDCRERPLWRSVAAAVPRNATEGVPYRCSPRGDAKSFRAASLCAAVLAFLAAAAALAQPGETPAKLSGWQAPSAEQVHAQLTAWLDQSNVDAAVRARVEQMWAGSERLNGLDLLEQVVRSFAVVDENSGKLVKLCSGAKSPPSLPPQPWLTDPKTPAWMAKNLRLWYGRWLAQQRLFDEALEQLEALQPEDVVDPASLLFYQAIVYHRLLNRDAGMEAVTRLLDGADQGPKRYATVARLIESDLRDLKEDSLDHIARRMEDIERRLDLGRGGPTVRKLQDGVVKSLDRLIEELEAAQQQQAAAAAGDLQPSKPAQDSVPMGGKGSGRVTKRDVGHQSGWGSLPPKQREEALQQIGRDFPGHYRDIIEQYFRKLASEGGK